MQSMLRYTPICIYLLTLHRGPGHTVTIVDKKVASVLAFIGGPAPA
jgi:hypothetical protein